MTERNVAFARLLELARAGAVRTDPEIVALDDALGRILVEPVRARADHPRFDNSAMDGWALRAAETPGRFEVVGESAAGAPFAGLLLPRRAIRIATGAQMPPGADAVLPVERAHASGGVLDTDHVDVGAHVRRAGEDLRAGGVVLPAGTRLGVHHLAAAAGSGAATLAVRRRPRVALLLTGDEVVPVAADPGPGQVWDISGHALPALLRAAGGEVVACIHVPDDRRRTEEAVASALDGADLVVTVGGVSVGAHDHVGPAIEASGATTQVVGARIRPGHPVRLARRDATPLLALPGNPVSAFVCLSILGRPLLGVHDAWGERTLAVDYRSPTARTDLIRCTETADGLVPAARQASHDISGLATATHIAVVPEGRGHVVAGEALVAVALA